MQPIQAHFLHYIYLYLSIFKNFLLSGFVLSQDCGDDDEKDVENSPPSSPPMAMNVTEDEDDDDNRCAASRGSASVPTSLMSSQSMVVAAAAAAAAAATAGRYSPQMQEQHAKATAAAVAHINGTSEYISFEKKLIITQFLAICIVMR